MCEVLDRIENRGIEKGIEKGKVLTLAELVKDGIISLKQAAERMGLTVAKFKIAMKEVAANWKSLETREKDDFLVDSPSLL